MSRDMVTPLSASLRDGLLAGVSEGGWGALCVGVVVDGNC